MILRALLLLPIAAGVLAGQQAFGESDKIAIEKMYSRYVTAFIKQDYTALRDSVQATPSRIIIESSAERWRSEATITPRLRRCGLQRLLPTAL